MTINAVCPGYVDTPMTDDSVAQIAGRTRMSEQEARARRSRDSSRSGDWSTVDGGGGGGACCASTTRAINGQGINVDGGAVQS